MIGEIAGYVVYATLITAATVMIALFWYSVVRCALNVIKGRDILD